MEPLSVTLLFFASVILLASWIMLIIAAMSSDDFAWGLSSIFLPPLGYIYALYRWENAGSAVKAAGLGIALLAVSQLL